MNCHDFHSGIGLPEELEGHHQECDDCEDWLRNQSRTPINCEIAYIMISVGTTSPRLRLHLFRCEACRRLDTFADLESAKASIDEAIKEIEAGNTAESAILQIKFAISTLETAKKSLEIKRPPS